MGSDGPKRAPSEQSRRIAAVLAAIDRANVRAWLGRLREALAGEPSLDDDTVRDLVDRGRPRWGVSTSDDADAYVDFWAELVQRYPVPPLLGGYADVLLLLGDRARTCEALDVYLDAVRRDPSVFISYSANFSDVAPQCGPRAQLAFELATIRFYAHLADQGEMEPEQLEESVRELLARYPDDPEVRASATDARGRRRR